MSISKKKSTTNQTTNQTTNLTTTPTNLPGADTAVSGLLGKIGTTFDGLDPYSLVAGPDKLQTQAADAAGGLTTSPNYGTASGILTGVAGAGPQSVQAGNIASHIGEFMNPYLKDVVDTSLADYDFGAGQAQGQANLDLGQDTTYGGSAGALYKRGLMDDILRGRGKLAAGLRSDAFNTSLGAAGQQAGLDTQASTSNASLGEQALARRAAAAQGLADIGSAQGADARANIGTQSTLGDMLRQIAQNKALAPVSTLGLQSGLLSGLPLDLFRGSNSTGSLSGTTNTTSKSSGAGLSDWLDFFKANAQAAAAGGA